MARSRNIKPSFFKNEDLAELPVEARILFIGTWCLADREGRIEDRPKKIKMEIFPADSVDVDKLLQKLHDSNFILRYEVSGKRCIQVLNFLKHQNPHHREVASVLPPAPGHIDHFNHAPIDAEQRDRILDRDGHKCLGCGSVDGLSIDHKVPRAEGGSSEDSNLQTLCRKCNSSKGTSAAPRQGSLLVAKGVSTDLGTASSRTKAGASRADSLIPDSLNLNPEKGKVGPQPDAAQPPGKNGHHAVRVLRAHAVEVLTFLNEKANRAYKPLPANVDMIVARLREGATLEDCRAVVAKKCREWLADPTMNTYLRPATLFNRTKFAQYQGELVASGGRQ